MIKLREAIIIMNNIKNNHPEVEIFIDSNKGKPYFCIQEKIIKLNEGCYAREV